MKIIKVPMKGDLLRRLSRKANARKLTLAALMCAACQDYLEKLGEGDLDWQYVAGYLRQPESAAVGETGERHAAEVWPREDWSLGAGPVKFRLHLLGKIILNADVVDERELLFQKIDVIFFVVQDHLEQIA